MQMQLLSTTRRLQTSGLCLYRPIRSCRLRSVVTMASLSVAVKGDPTTNTLGDCPFSHKVLLAMEQKALEYERMYVDFSNKPQWLFDVNPSGTVPVLKDGEKYIPESGVIMEYLENKFPNPSVPADPESSEAISGIFSAFRNYFLNKDPSQEETLKETLHAELSKLENRLGSLPGPFLGGETFNAADAEVLPRLYHAKTALGYYKNWTFPEDCSKVEAYLAAAEQTEPWKKCVYSPELIIKGWGSKL